MSTKGKTLTATIAIAAALALALIATPSIASPAFAKPPRETQSTVTNPPVTETTQPNGGLQKKETTQTTTTTTTTCANPAGNGPQGQPGGQFCPAPHETTSVVTSDPIIIDCGVSNKPGKGNPTGPDPCP